MAMSLTKLGADLLWNEGNVTVEQVRSEVGVIADLPLPEETKRDLRDRLQAVVMALEAAYLAMGKVAKDVHELAWHVDNGDVASFKLSPTDAEVKPIEDGNDACTAGCLCGHDDFCHFEGRCVFEGCECERQLATSFLEDCEKAKSAEDVRGLIGRYRDMPNNSAGGSLHIVLDDGSIQRSDVEHCVKWAVRRGDAAGLALANLLLRLDDAVYLEVLAADGTGPWENETAHEVG